MRDEQIDWLHERIVELDNGQQRPIINVWKIEHLTVLFISAFVEQVGSQNVRKD